MSKRLPTMHVNELPGACQVQVAFSLLDFFRLQRVVSRSVNTTRLDLFSIKVESDTGSGADMVGIYTRRLAARMSFGVAMFLASSGAGAQSNGDRAQNVESLNQQIQKDLQEQKPQLAIPLLREVITLEPDNINATADLGVLLFFQGSYPEAITQMRSALRLQPNLWRIEALLGIAEKRTGDPSAAQSDLEKAFPALDDKNIQKQAGLELMELTAAKGQLEKAAEVAATLEDNEPQDPQILFAAYELSLQMLDQTLLNMTMAAPNSAEMHMMMADELKRQGKTDSAIAQYRDAIRMNPQLPGVHYELAELLKDSSDVALHGQTEHEFKTALAVNPYDEKAWRELGEVLAEKGDLQAAREDFAKAIALQPNDPDAKTDLAKLLTSPSETKQAISLLEDAVRNDPTNIVAHYWLSSFYRQAGRTTDAQQQMEEYMHYKLLKEQLAKVFQQMRTQSDPAKFTGTGESR